MTSAAPRPSWPHSWQASEKPSSKRQPLTRERIVRAALAIVESEGLDALSMRRVAQELGTGAASLYAHISSKEELLEQVLDLVYGEIAVEPPDPSRWEDQLKEHLRRARAVLTSHGDLARAAMAANVPVTPNALDSAEAMLAILRAGGLDEQTIAYGVDLLSLFVTATAFEESSRQHLGEDDSHDYAERIRAFFETVPADRYPLVTAMAGPLTRDVGDERFEFGLDILVAGLARRGRG
ncbi:TetR family transcriptional regulator ActII [Kitasatospora atroaurantiaca]|uniref:TetR family transcriptional regulator n=1 Tax=Kitasatospora atroaurantiaca TaxID=285545 RepID=A0A561EJF8_9ACTN|nr:TetR/AcrR family transcriptional regulator [Kitasatospora atroaurantiaca]TWE15712.1 TetR family transcriptional regulator [Kitasatospora atroaurantiaca]